MSTLPADNFLLSCVKAFVSPPLDYSLPFILPFRATFTAEESGRSTKTETPLRAFARIGVCDFPPSDTGMERAREKGAKAGRNQRERRREGGKRQLVVKTNLTHEA